LADIKSAKRQAPLLLQDCYLSHEAAMTEQLRTKGAFQFDAQTLDAHHILHTLDAIATRKRYRRGEEICSSACTSDYLYRVASGAVKRVRTLPNGRQQIMDLLLPDDIFACAPNEHYSFSIEAAAMETDLVCFPRRRVEALAQSEPLVAKLFRGIAFETVCRLETQLLILGRTTAVEKIGAFILELSERQSDRVNSIVLPVSRYDIADYLALSVETVSRSLTNLRQRGLISFTDTRSIKIIDRRALEEARAA
jgi:CRP-like cAMP-binding protein